MSELDKKNPPGQHPKSGPELCIVLKGYPRLSETFIAQEIRQLEQSGFNIQIVSLRQPYDSATHPIHDEIVADILYLPEYLHWEPVRVIKALFLCIVQKYFWRTTLQFFKDISRDRTRNRLRRFGQACVMATECSSRARFFYAHFMHTPSSVAGYASQLRSTPWAISAHAKDIWTIPDWEKREKLQSAEWLVTCTKANFDYLVSINSTAQFVSTEDNWTDGAVEHSDNGVHLVYHGIDLARFDSPPSRDRLANGSSELLSVTLLSVGRTVTKKGYRYLLQALANLPANLHWKFVHIGGGELTEELQIQAKSLKIDQSIVWMGGKPQSVVLEALQTADLFVLPSIIGEDGDRDGLPNVLMEAQSQKLACLSTNISGIPELIDHGATGWLVDERRTDQLCEALELLITDPALRRRLASNGYENLRAKFSHDTCFTKLHDLLEHSMNARK